MTSTKVSTDRARARDNGPRDRSRDRLWFIPPGRDARGRGMCLFPRCETPCDRYQPACTRHWRNAPEPLTRAVRDGWQAKDQRRWLLAVEALHLYWHAIAP